MNPHQKPQEDVVVTQEDINAVIDLRYALDEAGSTTWSARVANPADHPVAKAFARHRLLGHEAGRRDMREAAAGLFHEWIGEGYEVPKVKTDQCEHGQFGWEDCIACYDSALAAKIDAWRAIPTEPLAGEGPQDNSGLG